MSERILPAKIAGYLRRLQVAYEDNGDALLSELIGASRFFVREDTAQDTNFGVTEYGHDVLLFIPLTELRKVGLVRDEKLREVIRADLNKCAASVPNEWVRALAFEPDDDNDTECQQSRSITGAVLARPDQVSFWEPGEIRLFVSHRDTHKRDARALGDALKKYGVCAFVAHDTIQPMSKWREEVRRGLETMEVMLAFITDDFDDSAWTHQEVGHALGRGVPVISVQVGAKAPAGFLEDTQAIKGNVNPPTTLALEVYRIIADKLGSSARIQRALVVSFVESGSYIDAKERFDRLTEIVSKLTEAELETITRAFDTNDQLYGSNYLTSGYNRLLRFLDRATGRKFQFAKNRPFIREIGTDFDLDDEIPF